MMLAELRRVRLYFKGSDNPTEDYMHKDQVAIYLEAKLQLHYQPGINPYNGNQTCVLWKVESEKLSDSTIYWHTTPGLDEKKSAGAPVSYFHRESRLWSHPECLEEERLARLEEERIEQQIEEGNGITVCISL